jgi:hypothetical protein
MFSANLLQPLDYLCNGLGAMAVSLHGQLICVPALTFQSRLHSLN